MPCQRHVRRLHVLVRRAAEVNVDEALVKVEDGRAVKVAKLEAANKDVLRLRATLVQTQKRLDEETAEWMQLLIDRYN